jgi:hypothetical protein
MLTTINWPLFMQVVLSLVIVAASLCKVLWGNGDTTTKHWAFGMIGMILGYWLKGH